METREIEVLKLTAEENYAHARDHEHLRAQVTAILVAAAFVLIGLAIDKQLSGARLVYVGGLSMLIGILNVVLIMIHTNRFDWHVSIARNAKEKIASVDVRPTTSKRYRLKEAWLVVATLPILAGLGLFVVSVL